MPASGLIKDNGDKKFETTFSAPKGKKMDKEFKVGGSTSDEMEMGRRIPKSTKTEAEFKKGGMVDEAKMEKKFMKDDAKSDKKQGIALEKKIEKKDDRDDARTKRKEEKHDKEDEPKMKKGGNVKEHKYGKKAHYYAEGGSVGFACMPKMMSDMHKVNKERDE